MAKYKGIESKVLTVGAITGYQNGNYSYFTEITQVMFIVLPLTLLAVACDQVWINLKHLELPLAFTFTNILLMLFFFPMLFVLIELLEENHTFDLLGTTIIAVIFLLLITLLLNDGVLI